MNIRNVLETRLADALSQVVGVVDTPALVAVSAKPQFGDYQANGVMAAAKRAKTNPRQLAEKLIEAVDLSDLAEKLEVAGPGFINITLKKDWLISQLTNRLNDEHLGVDKPANPQTVVVDYSSPAMGKEMHVGHLRSTIIGDALARILDFTGHNVIRQNHIGDWGTQFGMLTAYFDEPGAIVAKHEIDGVEMTIVDGYKIQDMEEFYRKAKALFDKDEKFADKSRQYVVKLQSGDERIKSLWEMVRDQSLEHCEAIYNQLGILLKRSDVRGESAYNDDLPMVADDLDKAGLLKESQGAQCVFPEGFKNKEGEPLPVIVRKSDGGYLYATTDLAAMRYRAGELHADRILYVTDSRQGFHFKQVFAVAREAKFVSEDVSLEHVPFGMMLGKNRQPFKTREGGTVKLMDLLNEAEQRAFELVSEKNPDLPEEQRRQIARIVGIGAVKYADLSQNRNSDYIFSWPKMLSLEGNTAPYMQYAYARICSIFRKKGTVPFFSEQKGDCPLFLHEPAERALGVKIAQFPETVQTVATECLPNVLCAYLFDLAGAFMSFYEACPVLKAETEQLRTSRLTLCTLTARTIKSALQLLGIETIEQM